MNSIVEFSPALNTVSNLFMSSPRPTRLFPPQQHMRDEMHTTHDRRADAPVSFPIEPQVMHIPPLRVCQHPTPTPEPYAFQTRPIRCAYAPRCARSARLESVEIAPHGRNDLRREPGKDRLCRPRYSAGRRHIGLCQFRACICVPPKSISIEDIQLGPMRIGYNSFVTTRNGVSPLNIYKSLAVRL